MIFEPKIIFVNGPPGAGKDTVSKMLNDLINIRTSRRAILSKFTKPMDDVLKMMWDACYLNHKYSFHDVRETYKDQPVLHAGGVPRQALIDLSESWFKKYGGPTIMGRIAANYVDANQDGRTTFIFSDSGFYQEAFGLMGNAKSATPSEMVVVQVHREGHSFEGDSRNWLDARDLGTPLIQLDNSGTLEELKQVCYNLFHALFIEKLDDEAVVVEDDSNNSSGGSPLAAAGAIHDVASFGEDDTSTEACGCVNSGKSNTNTDLSTSQQ
jgi:hypothetical protein